MKRENEMPMGFVCRSGPNGSGGVDQYIVEDPEIRGGIPTVRGTRVGAYEIAGAVRAGGMDEALETFPTVSREAAEAAVIWAGKNPRPERGPRVRPGRRLVSEKVVDLADFA